MPIFNVLIGVDIAALLPMGSGDTLLCASVSYVAAPAVLTFPRPILVSMALALRFPLIIIGIPIYFQLIHCFWG